MVVGAIVAAVAPQILGAAVQTRGGPLDLTPRAPRLPKGDLGKALQGIVDLQARGLEPVLSKNPFTGGLVLSTADQGEVLQDILFERQRREALAPDPQEIAEIRAFRQAFIERGRTQGLVDPRVAVEVGPVPPAVPVETVSTSVTARLVAPGVVERGTTPRVTSRRIKARLAGQCAGPQTGISRLRCGRGGFA